MSLLRCCNFRARLFCARQFSASSTRLRKVKTYHEILGVPKDSTKEQIKEAFFEKSKQLHPDTNTGDVEQFQELKTAYEHCMSFTKQPFEMTYDEIQAKER
ncbi:dnaJ homolog subfamily C member 4-like, partial [Saccostrea cucullata]|uniref:dnaJ homolog subfamily C member 4-like n=1 Tax=Saccostrea cuccullata TaxID=36930 RepID=UPI002ED0253A